MRATNLGFRSPKEKTAEYSNPVVTFDGRFLPLLHGNKTTTFEKAGPGSYNLTYSPGAEWRIKGTPLYKDLHGSKDTGDNGYVFIGNSMVYEPSFVFSRRKSLREPSSENTNRDHLQKSVSITDKSLIASDKKLTLKKETTPEEKDKDHNLIEHNRIKTSLPMNRRNQRKVSSEFRNSPYLVQNAKKIIIKRKNLEHKQSN